MMKRIFYFFAIVLCVACSNDEQFTTSSSDLLTLPDDTLKMDTVFSGASSSTYTFWIRNRNSKALRVNDVRLADGTQGFRVNVDGEYLHPNISGLEVLGDDSLLVFVEITAPEAGQLTPKPIDERLVLTLESGVQQEVSMRAWTWDAERWDNKTVTADEEITTQKPIIVYGTLTVAEGATLKLKGTSLYFHDGAGIDVCGALEAEGATLRGDRLDDMFSYLPYDHVSGQWRGISIKENARCQLTDCDIHAAHDALVAAAGSTLSLTRTVVHNNAGTGIAAADATVELSFCQVSNAEGSLVTAKGGTVTLTQCTLAQYYPFALRDVALVIEEGTELSITKLLIAGYDEELITLAEGMEIPEGESYTAEKEDFVLIDEDNLVYDFHLKPDSKAAGFGCY